VAVARNLRRQRSASFCASRSYFLRDLLPAKAGAHAHCLLYEGRCIFALTLTATALRRGISMIRRPEDCVFLSKLLSLTKCGRKKKGMTYLPRH